MVNHGRMISAGKNWRTSDISLTILPAESSSGKSGGTGGRKWWIWPYRVSLFILRSDVLHAEKSYDMGPTALLPLWRKACCGFSSPLKIQRREPWVQRQARKTSHDRGDWGWILLCVQAFLIGGIVHWSEIPHSARTNGTGVSSFT
jgi:hypothetical protein